MLKILEHLLYIIGMTWIENIEEATFARKKRMFEFNSLPCTYGKHICYLLITFARVLSVRIWFQTACKSYQQATLVGKEIKGIRNITGCYVPCSKKRSLRCGP